MTKKQKQPTRAELAKHIVDTYLQLKSTLYILEPIARAELGRICAPRRRGA
ncbi:MAG: hypothetical protein K2L94_04400 [Alphaproteobacteria bacterium]|nr:hypothetical protein [Alphaproteobacteria bacterium]